MAITVDMLIDFNVADANGTVLTVPIQGAGTQGLDAGFDVVPDPLTGFTVQGHQKDLFEDIIVRGVGTYGPLHTARSFSLDNTNNFSVARWWTNNVVTKKVSCGGWFQTSLANVGAGGKLYDLIQITGSDGTEPTVQLNTGTSPTSSGYGINVETLTPTTHSVYIEITPNVPYWLTLYADSSTTPGTFRFQIFDTNGVQVGSEINGSYTNPGAVDLWWINLGNNEIGNDIGTTWFENWLIDGITGTVPTFPLGPGTPAVNRNQPALLQPHTSAQQLSAKLK